jgi:hypothetical protein
MQPGDHISYWLQRTPQARATGESISSFGLDIMATVFKDAESPGDVCTVGKQTGGRKHLLIL